MRKPRLLKGGEVDFKLRRRAAWLDKLPRLSRPQRHGGPKLFVRESVYNRRSMVKIYYAHNRSTGGRRGKERILAHAHYMERGHGHEKGHKELGFDATNEHVDLSARARGWELANAPIHWRMVISPDDIDLIDAREHTRKVMARMEHDLGTPLQWVAIEHTDSVPFLMAAFAGGGVHLALENFAAAKYLGGSAMRSLGCGIGGLTHAIQRMVHNSSQQTTLQQCMAAGAAAAHASSGAATTPLTPPSSSPGSGWNGRPAGPPLAPPPSGSSGSGGAALPYYPGRPGAQTRAEAIDITKLQKR